MHSPMGLEDFSEMAQWAGGKTCTTFLASVRSLWHQSVALEWPRNPLRLLSRGDLAGDFKEI